MSDRGRGPAPKKMKQVLLGAWLNQSGELGKTNGRYIDANIDCTSLARETETKSYRQSVRQTSAERKPGRNRDSDRDSDKDMCPPKPPLHTPRPCHAPASSRRPVQLRRHRHQRHALRYSGVGKVRGRERRQGSRVGSGVGRRQQRRGWGAWGRVGEVRSPAREPPLRVWWRVEFVCCIR